MLRKIAIGLGAVAALVAVGFPAAGSAPADREYSVQTAAEAEAPNAPATIVPLVTEEAPMPETNESVTTEAHQPEGPAGDGVQILATESGGAEITTNPVETNPDGTPKYLSQDGAAGEHASTFVSHAVRTMVASGELNAWRPQFGETDQSSDTATVFWVEVDGERFLLTLEKDNG